MPQANEPDPPFYGWINSPPTGTLTIRGTPRQGETLTIENTLTDTDGISSSINYQWLRNGEVIDQATSETYIVKASDIGTTISVNASYTDDAGTNESVLSTETAPIAARFNLDGLVAYYSFDNPLNLAHDDSGKGNNGTVNASATVASTTFAGGAVQFGGFYVPGYIHVANSSSLQFASDFSISYALRLTSAEGMDIGKKLADYGYHATVAKQHDRFGMALVASIDPLDGTIQGGLASNTWQSLGKDSGFAGVNQWNTFTWNFSNLNHTSQLYVNGELVAVNNNFTQDLSVINAQDLYIGRYSDTWYPLNGLMDEVLIYNRAISAAEALSLSRVPGNAAPTGSVLVSGQAVEGATLQASHSLADEDGLGTVSYQWLADGLPIANATGNTYLIKTTDIGKLLSVRASYTDGAGVAERTTSAPTAAVAPDLSPKNLLGTQGDDTLTGASANDTLNGREGNDLLLGHGGGDSLLGGDGEDTLIGGPGNDTLNGGAGTTDQADYSSSTSGVNADLSTGSASDGLGGSDQLSGIEFLAGSIYNDTLTGNASANNIKGQTGNDLIQGEGGNDLLWGMTGNDTLLGGTGDDQVYGDAGDDSLEGGDGNDILGGDEGLETGNIGNDTLRGGAGNDALVGNAGNDALYGDDGQDGILGGLGNDFLDGGADTDVLSGDAGDNTLNGGAGVDTADYMEAPDSVTVDLLSGSANNGYGGTDVLSGIEVIQGAWWFANTLRADSGNNTLSGGSASDLLDGRGDHDQLIGNKGDDTLLGGDGDDSLSGGWGADQLSGGAGNDTLDPGDESTAALSNVETLEGGSGTDLFDLASSWYAGRIIRITDLEAGEHLLFSHHDFPGSSHPILSGNNPAILQEGQVMVGSPTGGNTRLYVGAPASGESMAPIVIELTGNYAATAFRWVVNDFPNDSTMLGYGLPAPGTVIGGTAGADTQTGSTGNDTLASSAGNDSLNGGAGTDTVDFSQESAPVSVILYGNQSHGLSIGVDTLTSIENIIGSQFNDLVYGDLGDNLIQGGLGQDTLDGAEGHDTLQGQTGDDLLNGLAGNDSLEGSEGNDSIYGWADLDTLVGGLGDDRLFGGAQADVLDGGDGADNLEGDDGNDTLTGAVGNDTLRGWNDNDSLDGGDGDDALFGGAGADVMLGGVGTDNLEGDDGNDTITGGIGNDTLRGWNDNDSLDGGDGNDLVVGWSGNDSLVGGLGDDQLFGDDGADTLVGGAGGDVLQGGLGNDVYTFATGFGFDGVKDYDYTAGNSDTFQFTDINRTDLGFAKVGDALKVERTASAGADVIYVNDWYMAGSNGAYKIESWIMGDGTYTAAQIEALVV